MHSVMLRVLSVATLAVLTACPDRPLPEKMTDSDVGTTTFGTTDQIPPTTVVPMTTELIPDNTPTTSGTSGDETSESGFDTTTGLTLCEQFCSHCPIGAHDELCDLLECENWVEFCWQEANAFIECSLAGDSDMCSGTHASPDCYELWQLEGGLFRCIVSYCGDNILQDGLGEECDDGNTVGGDGCNPWCRIEASCNGCEEGEK